MVSESKKNKTDVSGIGPKDLIYFDLWPSQKLFYWLTGYMPEHVVLADLAEQKARKGTSKKVYADNVKTSKGENVALFKVIWKLLNSGSKLNSVFVLKLDELLNSLSEVADKGGVLVLKVSLGENGQILVEDEVQVGSPKAKEKTSAKKASASTGAGAKKAVK